MGKTLIIWFKDGGICKFEQVENFYDRGIALGFTYFKASTQVKRKAWFSRTHVVGYALED